MLSKVFHVDDGEKEMYEVDAGFAVREHPLEWSRKPWTDSARSTAKAELAKRKKKPEDTAAPALSTAASEPRDGAMSSDTVKFEAKHRGAGSYSIVDVAGNEVLEKMSKDDAEAFNSMSDAEKAEWVRTNKKS